jgi:hypothetical protein
MPESPQDAGAGALFRNDRKEKPSHADYRGDITIHGRTYLISAWIRTSERTGRRFLSLALREAAPGRAPCAAFGQRRPPAAARDDRSETREVS